MRTKLSLIAATLLALALTNGAVVAAQTPPPNQRGGRGAGGRGARLDGPPEAQSVAAMNDVQDMLDARVLVRAQPMLQLTDGQYGQFFKNMRALQGLRRRHQVQRQRLLGELRRMTAPQNPEPADDATLDAKTKAFDDLESQMFQEEQKSLAAVDALLTPRQRAQFRVFEENMEREKLKLLAKALVEPAKTPPPVPKK